MINIHFLLPFNGYHKNLAYPIVNAHNYFKDAGIRVKFFEKPKDSFGEADIVIISGIFLEYDRNYEEDDRKFEFVQSCRKKTSKVIYFDTSDSTGTPLFKILPYVDTYVKQFMFTHLEMYNNNYYQTRIWADYYHKKYGIDDDYYFECYLPEEYKKKIRLGWNYGLSPFYKSKLTKKIYKGFLKFGIPLFIKNKRNFTKSKKSIPVSMRINTKYFLKTVSIQRELLAEHFSNEMSMPIKEKCYWKEILKSKICISPFGWGEVCLRDFEAIINFNCLFKPDITHVELFPKYFVPFKTYVPFKWDLSDLDELIEHYLANDYWVDIAIAANNLYNYYVYSEDGKKEFFDHFRKTLID